MMLNGETQLVGLVGWPVAHSFSPAMQNAALRAMGLNWIYIPLPVSPEQVGEAVRGLAALGFRGANVTVPHKQAVIPYLHEVSAAAATIGAVNTILVGQGRDGRLAGENTDWRGLLADLVAQDVGVDGRDCLVLGAGGSARAVVYGLNAAGGRVHVAARRVAQAEQLGQELGADMVEAVWPLAPLDDVVLRLKAPLIINTTPVGMAPFVDQSVWPEDLAMPAGSFAYDLIYNPAETRFTRQAAACGCRASNGLGMLLHQGAASLAMWTGRQPDLPVMQKALEEARGTEA